MRGRQQVYLTIGCAPNWPGLAHNPRPDMPILGEKEWAAGVGAVGLCPAVGRTAGHVQVAGMGSVGHAHSWREGVGILGLCPALKWAAGHVQVAGVGSVGHAHSWREGVGILGLCPALKWAAGHVPR